MRLFLGFVVLITVVLTVWDAALANQTNDSDKKMDFPYRLPNSRTNLDRQLVDKLNEMTTKKEQIKYLLDLLPDKDAKKKVLTDKELHAIRLLGLTKSKDVIQPLIEHLDFVHSKDGAPAAHSLARLGEIAVEPLILDIQKANDLRLNLGVMALKEIKKEKFVDFVHDIKQRKDITLSAQTIKMLDTFIWAQKNLRREAQVHLE